MAGGTAKAARAATSAAAAAVELVQRSARRVARARAGLHRRGAPAVDEALHHVVVERRRLACAATVSTPHEAHVHVHVGRRRWARPQMERRLDLGGKGHVCLLD